MKPFYQIELCIWTTWLFFVLLTTVKCQDFDVVFPHNQSQRRIPNGNTSSLKDEVTVCLWLRPLHYNREFNVIFSLYQNGMLSTPQMNLTLNTITSEQVITIHNEERRVLRGKIANGHWHHICIAWKSEYGKYVIMFDGETAVSCSGLATNKQFSQLPLLLALGYGNPSLFYNFQGQMTSFYIWSSYLPLHSMREMFLRCQPNHILSPEPAVKWQNLSFDASVNVSTPSKCHTGENFVLQSSLPARFRDEQLKVYTNAPSPFTITLPYKIVITEVFVQTDLVPNVLTSGAGIYNMRLFLGYNELKMCQPPPTIYPRRQSVVFYCQSETLFAKSLILKTSYTYPSSDNVFHSRNMGISEILVFGKKCPHPPAAVFPLSSKSSGMVDFGTNSKDFKLRAKISTSYSNGVTEEGNGASLFSNKNQESTMIYDINSTSPLFQAKSLTLCGWINFHEFPTSTAIIFGFLAYSKLNTRVLIKNTEISALIGYEEQEKINRVIAKEKFPFKLGVWYHVTMSYDDINKYGQISIHDVKIGAASRKAYLSLSYRFAIGHLFPGKIACVQIFAHAIAAKDISQVMHHCYEGQSAPLKPLVLFPFGVNNTYNNTMDLFMKTVLQGNHLPGAARLGVISEPLNAMTFQIPTSKDCNGCPPSSLKLEPYYNLKECHAITVSMWIKILNLPHLEKCFLYDQGSLKIVAEYDTKMTISVEYKYEILQNGTKTSALLITENLPWLRGTWLFVVFSFVGYTGEVSLEITGALSLQRILIKKQHTCEMKLDALKKERLIAKNCNTKIACLQVFNSRLTNQQTAMVKYTCLAGKEGLHKFTLVPRLTTSKVYAPMTTLWWGISWYCAVCRFLGIPIQGYRVMITNNKTGNLDIYNITSCVEEHIFVTNLEDETLYSAQMEPFGYSYGPLSPVRSFYVYRVPIWPPSNIQVNATGQTNVTITWKKSISQVSGYLATATSLGPYSNTSLSIATCSNQTTATFTNLAAFSKYNITVVGFDAKQLGIVADINATTQEEPPRLAPTSVRAFNVRMYKAPMLTIYWNHLPHPELKGIIRGYKIFVWLTNNSSSSWVFYISNNRNSYKTKTLDLSQNYTVVIRAYTGSPVMGPASQPVTNHEEIGAILPPKHFKAEKSNLSCNQVILSWQKPAAFPLSGIHRMFRITYYNYTGGSKAAKHLVQKTLNAVLTNLTLDEVYGICVAAQTTPNTPFGPCTDVVNVSTSCTNSENSSETPITTIPTTTSPPTSPMLLGSWGEWSKCNETCGHGVRTRYRRCLVGSCSMTTLVQNQPCYQTTGCLELSIDANLTSQKWNDSLLNNRSENFKVLESQLCSSMANHYGSISCHVEKFWQGSVMTTLHVNFASLSAESILKVQESMEINKTLGTVPAILNNVHSKTVPDTGPNITSVNMMTATSVQVSWGSISFMYKDIQGYVTSYRPVNSFILSTVTCGSSCTSIVVDNVQPNVTYRFRVQAYNAKGYGIAGNPVSLTIPPLVSKNIYPANVLATGQSSTSIVVQWDPLPDGVMSGTFLGYRIVCQETHSGKIIEKTVKSWVVVAIFESLDTYSWYSVRVFGLSDQGIGIANPPILVRTLEDIPSAPPSDIVVQDMFHTKMIKMKWSPVSALHRNGIILGYRIKYKMASASEYDGDKTHQIDLPPNATEYVLGNLAVAAKYEIELLAYNSVGNGQAAKMIGGTCKCNADIYSNYISYPPYVIVNPNTGVLDGIFGSIVEDMILTVCGVCPNGHGKSKLHFNNNGKGHHSNKQTQTEVFNDIDDVTDVSFPVYGYVTDTDYMKYYGYVPIVQSPGIAFIAIRKQVSTETNNAVYNMITSSWMLLILLICLMYLFGIIVWATDNHSNPDHFPLAFHQGAWEGLWFTFVSMTTVGYGDRVPISVITRLVSIAWTLMGLVVVSIFMGIVTSSLTVITTEINQEATLYGANVSAVENSTEYKTGILKNAKMVGYPTLTDTYNSLSNGYIQGALVDAYVAGSAEQLRRQPENAYVNRVIDKSISYGVVLSGRVTRLGSDCREYIKQNQAKIAKLVTDFVQPIDKNLVVNNNQTDEPVVTPHQSAESKIDIMDVIKFLLIVLGALIGAGAIWDCFYVYSTESRTAKVKPTYPEDILEMRDSVRKLYRRTNRIVTELREKHRKELEYFWKNNAKNRASFENNVSNL